ncbi:hypothetical protein [Amycolatopsis sp. H20-H5]|uniref:hypothetical protein n=1 Tax=Amycolatopsis sp. H20-H5 TaxID=3046309 RepID=UPI002DBD287C|nr:hypothetical protein [Amycolatopsis sp. H20-H5]MEC3976557.1 hypothetical protein [Amycolatopsis sp. H20-H5]
MTRRIDELVERGAGLKGELVEFAQGPRFAKQLNARLADAGGEDGYFDDSGLVHVIDHFALQYPLPGGQTVVEQFATRRRPALSAEEREMVLGWRDVVEGVFEVQAIDEDAIVLHNLVDDLVYRTYSNVGPSVFAQVREGMFAICRIVPVHPATEAWMISGYLSVFPKSQRRQLAKAALEMVTANPRLLWRNPDKLRRAWAQQAEDRAGFIATFGADLVILSPAEAQKQLQEHYRRRRAAAASSQASDLGGEELGLLSDDFLDSESLGLIYDEVEGLTIYAEFGRLDALFADPALVRDRTYVAQLREYLEDDSVSPVAIRRLVERHPEGVDAIFGTVLRKTGFSWPRDGEKLLRRKKTGLLRPRADARHFSPRQKAGRAAGLRQVARRRPPPRSSASHVR